MTHFEQLLITQDLDTRLDQLTHRRAALPERTLLVEAEAVLAVNQSQLDEQQQVVTLSTRELRRSEDALSNLETRAKDIDHRLYGGTVSKAGDLQDLQTELDSVRRRIEVVEEEAFAAMEKLEVEQAAAEALAEQRRAIEAHRTGAEVTLTTAAAEIDAEVEELRAQRAVSVSGIPADLLAEYEHIRSGLKGVGVAKLTRNRCEGCHLTLASAEVDRIRHLDPDVVVHCEECGRILVR